MTCSLALIMPNCQFEPRGIEVDKQRETINNLKKMYSTNYRNCAKPSSRFNVLFDEQFTREFFPNQKKSNASSVPMANVKETETEFVIELAVPGMEKSDFKISVNKELLTISAAMVADSTKEEKDNYTRKEFSFKNFSRSFNLPEVVDQAKIMASYVNGVLHLTLPKKTESVKNDQREISVN
jgi:HSP20 family protein